MTRARCCDGKLRHLSESGALAAVERMRRVTGRPAEAVARLLAYRCDLCTFWHVGHARRFAPFEHPAR